MLARRKLVRQALRGEVHPQPGRAATPNNEGLFALLGDDAILHVLECLAALDDTLNGEEWQEQRRDSTRAAAFFARTCWRARNVLVGDITREGSLHAELLARGVTDAVPRLVRGHARPYLEQLRKEERSQHQLRAMVHLDEELGFHCAGSCCAPRARGGQPPAAQAQERPVGGDGHGQACARAFARRVARGPGVRLRPRARADKAAGRAHASRGAQAGGSAPRQGAAADAREPRRQAPRLHTVQHGRCHVRGAHRSVHMDARALPDLRARAGWLLARGGGHAPRHGAAVAHADRRLVDERQPAARRVDHRLRPPVRRGRPGGPVPPTRPTVTASARTPSTRGWAT